MIDRFVQTRAFVRKFLAGRAVLCARLPGRIRIGAHGATRPTFPFGEHRDFYSRAYQNFECLAAMFRIGVRRADNDAPNAGGFDGVGARRRAAVRAARFECDIKRRAFGAVPTSLRIANRFHFRVRFARAMMPALADDFGVLHQHRADHWVGRSQPVGAAREA